MDNSSMSSSSLGQFHGTAESLDNSKADISLQENTDAHASSESVEQLENEISNYLN